MLVSGAGPSGSVAALLLARAGVGVRIVDRARFPRDKLCGDTLNPGAMALLERLGLAAAVRASALRVTGMRVTGPGGASVTGDYGAGIAGAALTRRDLDAILLHAAVRAGARLDDGLAARQPILDNGRVTGLRLSGPRGDEAASARVVIAADGRHSTLAFGLGMAAYAATPRRWAFGAYYAGVTGMADRGEMHIRPDGYVGVAPVPGGLANVCVVRAWRRGVDPPLRGDLVAEAIAADPELRQRFSRADRVSGVTVLGPMAIDTRAAGMPGLLLAGDAAGFIDPMTGDGLRFAIRGGELAAAAALEELTSGVAAYAGLARRRRQEFAGKWRFNRVLRALVASPRGVAVAAAVAARWSAPIRPLIACAGDVGRARPAAGESVTPR